ncbi:MAG: hypothetical protein KAH03_03580 [Cocleimonas sp.]|nr:hypothetical protein [Cocleimonas sp.]
MYSDLERQDIVARFINNEYEQIICDQCVLTFLTNVYNVDSTHVLLEKRSLGLEYFCEAIQSFNLIKIPHIERICVLDEEDKIVKKPASKQEIFSGQETDHRYLYIVEKLEHLGDKDTVFFNQCVKDMNWKDDVERQHILAVVEQQYGELLAKEIRQLYNFYARYKNVLAWDLHGDNLMQKIDSNEIVVIDPYTRRA